MSEQRLLNRFLDYVRVDTQAGFDSTSVPTTPGQLRLGAQIAEELRSLGLVDVEQDATGTVYGTVPATPGLEASPVVAFNAHLDTSPETSGRDVKPRAFVYQGGDVALTGDPTKVLRAAENPALADCVGKTIVVTDGTTLLGSDDKSGVAVIVEAAARLMERRELPHGPVRIFFTCDEEIGRGVEYVDLAKVNAVAAYTLDGEGAGAIDDETFDAMKAVVTFHGINIHPSIAKGRMVNSLRALGHFLERLPQNERSPETTDGREGFIHPVRILESGVDRAAVEMILRDFDRAKLESHLDLVREAAAATRVAFPGLTTEVEATEQYANLGPALARQPHIVQYAEEAYRRAGIAPRRTIIRGGTDGSFLTARGLLTPNLSTGEHNPHSPLEWTCLEEMETAVRTIVELVQIWAERSGR
ncbi:MAG TPA: peptidase T [Pirellulaceae bacterium]|nr:peptidase T [Pirellulaceae bacterium]